MGSSFLLLSYIVSFLSLTNVLLCQATMPSWDKIKKLELQWEGLIMTVYVGLILVWRQKPEKDCSGYWVGGAPDGDLVNPNILFEHREQNVKCLHWGLHVHIPFLKPTPMLLLCSKLGIKWGRQTFKHE